MGAAAGAKIICAPARFSATLTQQHYYTAGRAADDSVESVRTMCRHHLLVVLQPLIAVQVSQCLASFKTTTQPLPASEGLGSLLIALNFTFELLRLYSCDG